MSINMSAEKKSKPYTILTRLCLSTNGPAIKAVSNLGMMLATTNNARVNGEPALINHNTKSNTSG